MELMINLGVIGSVCIGLSTNYIYDKVKTTYLLAVEKVV